MSQVYSAEELRRVLADHPGWSAADDGTLEAGFEFRDFAHALLFVSAVGHLAEAQDHHPDITVHGYKRVRLNVMSHDVGGITERDVSLIRAVEALPGAADALS